MSAASELYQQVILEHNRSPRNFGRIDSASHSAHGDNPLCGDRYTVQLKVDSEGKVATAAFHGSGCAISKASASLMTEAVAGLTTAGVASLIEEFHGLVKGELDTEQVEQLGKLKVFAGIWEYPARVKCAILSWHALSSALAAGDDISTEK